MRGSVGLASVMTYAHKAKSSAEGREFGTMQLLTTIVIATLGVAAVPFPSSPFPCAQDFSVQSSSSLQEACAETHDEDEKHQRRDQAVSDPDGLLLPPLPCEIGKTYLWLPGTPSSVLCVVGPENELNQGTQYVLH